MKMPNNEFFLKDIAEIRSGYLFKSGLDNEPGGNLQVVQLKDVSDHGCLSTEGLTKINFINMKSQYLLEEGDVLFKAKSNKHLAAVAVNIESPMVATAHYFIIKIKYKALSPHYLAWFINRKPGQKYFSLHSEGTHIPVVKKKLLGELAVAIPPLELQEKIVKIFDLLLKEKELSEKLIKRRKQYIENILLNIIDNKSAR